MKVEGGSPKVEGPAWFTVDAMEWVVVQGPTPGAPRNRFELTPRHCIQGMVSQSGAVQLGLQPTP